MKPSASFYNVGRGPSVDTAALAKALEKSSWHLPHWMFLKKSHCPKMIRYGTSKTL